MAGNTLTVVQVFIGILVAVAAVFFFTTLSIEKKENSSIANVSQPIKVDIIEPATNDEPSEPIAVKDPPESATVEESMESMKDARALEPEPVHTESSNTAEESPKLNNVGPLNSSSAGESSEEITVELMTKLGKVRGTEHVIAESRVIHTFKGIPYAKPPVGELRFKAPVPIEPWSGVKGGQTPPICPQVDFTTMDSNETKISGQEDCLYLNVYVPKNSEPNLPVMVFIHGGAFLFGDAQNVGGTPNFLLVKDVILVSIQYRLGVLGFLSTGDSIIPGNFGMKDQSLALRWVQENIQDFGGDPGQVTIFGQSAGGASVHFHLLSPYSEGLFQRAIPMSGTALAPWAIRDNPRDISKKIEKLLDCSGDGESLDSNGLLECLREASVEDITLKAFSLQIWEHLPFPLVPCIDGDYLPDHPAQLLKSGRFHKVDIMTGITANENVFRALDLIQKEDSKKKFLAKFDIFAPILCSIEEEESGVSIMKSAFYHYLDGIEISEDYFIELDQLVNDCYFNINHDETVLSHAADERINVFAYELEYQARESIADTFAPGLVDKDYVPHGCDIELLFNNVFGLPNSGDETDHFVSDIMVKLWTDFAITGNPTPDLSLGFKWLPVAKDSYHYLGIGPAPSMRNDKRAKRREFWRMQPTRSNRILYEELFAEDPTTANIS
ncbi:venom carboxylesterase-6-like [Palaemon carinicauda]|uniref:venom carboxylesterase-6-like n=1 Tax=Palaemon carinicauda TaxID=392227 RepID=UPI0035B5B449